MTRRARHSLLSSLAVALIAATSLQAADRALTGNWEFKMTTDGHTTTATQCVTKEMAAASNGDTKTARAAAEKAAKGRCTFDSFDATGDTVTYTMNCGGTVMESSGTYHGDAMSGVLKTTRQGRKTTTSVTGHRLGACPATQDGKR